MQRINYGNKTRATEYAAQKRLITDIHREKEDDIKIAHNTVPLFSALQTAGAAAPLSIRLWFGTSK